MNGHTDLRRELVRRRLAELAADAWAERLASPRPRRQPRPNGLRTRLGRTLIAIGRALANEDRTRRAT